MTEEQELKKQTKLLGANTTGTWLGAIFGGLAFILSMVAVILTVFLR